MTTAIDYTKCERNDDINSYMQLTSVASTSTYNRSMRSKLLGPPALLAIATQHRDQSNDRCTQTEILRESDFNDI
jgi:hypothetical protein